MWILPDSFVGILGSDICQMDPVGNHMAMINICFSEPTDRDTTTHRIHQVAKIAYIKTCQNTLSTWRFPRRGGTPKSSNSFLYHDLAWFTSLTTHGHGGSRIHRFKCFKKPKPMRDSGHEIPQISWMIFAFPSKFAIRFRPRIYMLYDPYLRTHSMFRLLRI